jgi:hypothetical protein
LATLTLLILLAFGSSGLPGAFFFFLPLSKVIEGYEDYGM